MGDNKDLLIFGFVFSLLILAVFALANYDSITPAVAEAQAGMAIGTTTVVALEKGAAIFLKLLLGTTITGVGIAVYAEARSAYKAWKRSAGTGRWHGGPNANWQKQAPAEPRLTRQDLMLLALAGQSPLNKTVRRPSVSQEPSDEDDLDVEL